MTRVLIAGLIALIVSILVGPKFDCIGASRPASGRMNGIRAMGSGEPLLEVSDEPDNAET